MPGSTVKDLRYFENFVKSVTLSDYNVDVIRSEFRGYGIRHQVAPEVNRGLSDIQIELKLSEDLLNYLHLYYYMQQIRYGDIDTSHTEAFRLYAIKRINIELMDNQKRVIMILYFTNAFLRSLSSISLTMGSSEELVFTTNWSYEECKFETKSILGS